MAYLFENDHRKLNEYPLHAYDYIYGKCILKNFHITCYSYFVYVAHYVPWEKNYVDANNS